MYDGEQQAVPGRYGVGEGNTKQEVVEKVCIEDSRVEPSGAGYGRVGQCDFERSVLAAGVQSGYVAH